MWNDTKNDVGYSIITPTFRRISKHDRIKKKTATPHTHFNSKRWKRSKTKCSTKLAMVFSSNAAGTTETIEYRTTKWANSWSIMRQRGSAYRMRSKWKRHTTSAKTWTSTYLWWTQTKRWHHNTLQSGVFIWPYVCCSIAMFAQYLFMRTVLISCMPSDWDDGDRNETHELCGWTRVLISTDVNMQHGH